MKRIFKAGKYLRNSLTETKIDRWEWTRNKGLYVVFKNGLSYKSGYTLPEFLTGKYENFTELKQEDE